jgi:hypothetical protein
VDASEWIDQQLVKGDLVLTVVPAEFPALIGPHYGYLLDGSGGYDTVIDLDRYYGVHSSTPEDIAALIGLSGHNDQSVFIVFSDSQWTYAQEHDLFPADGLSKLEAMIDADPRFARQYESPTVRIYRYQVTT